MAFNLDFDLNNPMGALLDLREEFEFENVSYSYMSKGSNDVVSSATFSKEWIDHYVENSLDTVDPIVQESLQSVIPLIWDTIADRDDFKSMMYVAEDFGISRTGLSIPIRGYAGEFGLLILNRSKDNRNSRPIDGAMMAEVLLKAVVIHDGFHKSTSSPTYSLSQREIEVLHWTCAGKSQADIGQILSLATRTVETHLRSAREKLGTMTTPQAIGRAVARGIIIPS